MVYLGGPPSPRKRRGLWLHDPPPGYHPPRPRVSLKQAQRQAREEYVLMRVTTVILVVVAAAVLVIIFLIFATH